MGIWEDAKRQAQLEGKANDWAYVMNVCRQMGSLSKSVSLYIDGNKLELLGQSKSGSAIAKSESGEVVELLDKDYNRSRKIFKSKASSNLVPVKKLVRRADGTSFMQTFYVSVEEAKELSAGGVVEEESDGSRVGKEDEETQWRNKTAELQADIAAMWQLQCRNLYQSANLGALAVREGVQNSRDAIKQALKDGVIKQGVS